MADWLKSFLKKPKQNSSSSQSSLEKTSKYPSSPSGKSSGLTSSPKGLPPTFHGSSSSSARWSKAYDVCICHSEKDLAFVEEMASYLQEEPEHLRCFLQFRDAVPGGPIVTELCDAVQNSHCQVLLITPSFLQDPWCEYQMHHALAEAPVANGRTIPVLKDVSRSDYPRVLQCIYYITATLQENSFRQIKETILRYLEAVCQRTSKKD